MARHTDTELAAYALFRFLLRHQHGDAWGPAELSREWGSFATENGD